MKRTYLTKNGTVELLHHKQIKASWLQMHNAQVDYVSKKEQDFLHKYGLKTTIFNVANLRKYGYVHLYPSFIKIVLNKGAVDKRKNNQED